LSDVPSPDPDLDKPDRRPHLWCDYEIQLLGVHGIGRQWSDGRAADKRLAPCLQS
jgi:hypothetical protein